MTCQLQRQIGRQQQRWSDYRQQVKLANGSDPAAGIVASGLTGIAGLGSLGEEEEQQKHFRGWTYVAITRIATKIAGQTPLVGRTKPAPANQPRGRRCTHEEYNKAPESIRRKATAAEITIIEGHPFLQSLTEPNPVMGQWSLIYTIIASLELTGKAYWWTPIVDGKQQVWPVPSNWVTPKHDGGIFSSFVIQPPNSAQSEPIPAEEMIYFGLPDPKDPLSAVSPLQSQAPAVAIDEAIQSAQHRHYMNGIFPKVILRAGRMPSTMPGTPGEIPVLKGDQRRDLIEAIKTVYQGVVNYDEPLILDGLIEGVDKFSNSVQEMDYLDSSSHNKGRIFQAFGVNPIIAGETENANRAQAAVAGQLFAENVINPLLEMIGQTVTAWLRRHVDPVLVFWLEAVRAQDSEQRLREWKEAAAQKFVTGNEFRAAVLGLPPLDELDELPVAPTPLPFGGAEATGMTKQPSQKWNWRTEPEVLESLRTWGRRNRRTIVDVFVKQSARTEASFEAAIHRYLQGQTRIIVRELRELHDASPALFGDAAAAKQIVDMVFRPDEWNDILNNAARFPIIATVVDGYMAAQAFHEMRTRDAVKATTEELLAGLSGQDAVNFLTDVFDTFQIPPDVMQRIAQDAETVMAEPWWSGINVTQRNDMARILASEIELGHSFSEIAKALIETVGDGNGNRSMLIARTEVTGLLNSGHQLQAREVESTGVLVVKFWLDTDDELVRNTHLAVAGNGPVAGADGMFDVGGFPAPYPGHWSLPVQERANCRCAIITEVDLDSLESIEAYERSLLGAVGVEVEF